MVSKTPSRRAAFFTSAKTGSPSGGFTAFVLCFFAFFVYLDTFDSSFHFDDIQAILKNPYLRSISFANLAALWKWWATRFLTFSSFALNFHLYGFDVRGYHAANFFLHLACGLTCWRLFRNILQHTGASPGSERRDVSLVSFFIALFFLIHPVQTEAVTYIVQRSTVLAAFFYLTSLFCYVKARRQQLADAVGSRKTVFLYLLSWLLALAACLSKENAVTLPLMLGLLEWTLFERGRAAVRRLVPFFFLLFLVPAILFSTHPPTFSDMRILKQNPQEGLSYLLTQARVIVTYVRLLFFPFHQRLIYDVPLLRSAWNPPVFLSLFFLGLLFAAAIRLLPRFKLISLGIFWFFLTLLPESGIVPLRDVIFEHRLYLPMIGWSLALASTLIYFSSRGRKIVLCFLLTAAVGYAAAAFQRNAVWKDEMSLWEDVIRRAPQKAIGYLNRGEEYHQRGQWREALEDHSRAIALDPLDGRAYVGRGNIYQDRGQFDLAIADFNRVISLDPGGAFYYINNRGNAYFDSGRIEEALADYAQAIALNPGYAPAYVNRAAVFVKMNKIGEALSDLSQALRLDSVLPQAYYQRAKIFFSFGRDHLALQDAKKIEALGYALSEDLAAQVREAEMYVNLR